MRIILKKIVPRRPLVKIFNSCIIKKNLIMYKEISYTFILEPKKLHCAEVSSIWADVSINLGRPIMADRDINCHGPRCCWAKVSVYHSGPCC